MKTSEALKLRQDTLTQSMNTIEKKINALGLAESSVQQRGGSDAEAELLVQLPGVDDPARVKQILKTAAMLELYEVQGGPFASREEAHVAARTAFCRLNSARFCQARRAAERPSEVYILARTPVVTGRDLARCQAAAGSMNGRWETNFVLTQDAAKRFERSPAPTSASGWRSCWIRRC